MARRVYAAHYRMTARRRAALRKAQIASARKRKRNKNIAKTAVGVVAVTAVAGGAYKRSRKKTLAAQNVVQQTTLAGFRPNQSRIHTVSVVKGSSAGKEIDITRFDIKGQIMDENSKIDFGKVGTPRQQRSWSTFKRSVAQNKINKAAKGTRGRRIIAFFANGDTEPVGYRARWNQTRRMQYSSFERSASYRAERDRPNPPRWLKGLNERRDARNAAALREQRAAKQRKRRAKIKAKGAKKK